MSIETSRERISDFASALSFPVMPFGIPGFILRCSDVRRRRFDSEPFRVRGIGILPIWIMPGKLIEPLDRLLAFPEVVVFDRLEAYPTFDRETEGAVFFRFVCALILAAMVSMTGIMLEKQTLERKRDVTRQYYQLDLLLELHAQSRLRIQKLTSPSLQIAAQGLLPSSSGDSNWAIESYLVTDAESEVAVDSIDARLPSDSQAEPSQTRPSKSNLPLLRWQQPVSADRADPNRR